MERLDINQGPIDIILSDLDLRLPILFSKTLVKFSKMQRANPALPGKVAVKTMCARACNDYEFVIFGLIISQVTSIL